jgi:hypothetical protein
MRGTHPCRVPLSKSLTIPASSGGPPGGGAISVTVTSSTWNATAASSLSR